MNRIYFRSKTTLFTSIIFSIFLLILCGFSTSVRAQYETTRGKTFWLGFMENASSNRFNEGERIAVFISCNKNTSGRVSIPQKGWSRNFSVNAGTTTEVKIPDNQAHTTGSDVTEDMGVLVETEDSVNVYALNYRVASEDASVILPIQALKNDYRVIAYNEGASLSEFMIVATEDGTEVEISPSVPLVDGKNFTYIIRLDRGQVYQAQSEKDLTGTRIRSTKNNCKSFAVFGGNVCANIGGCGRCDHVFEQMFPVTTWGREYLTVPLRSRTSDKIRVMASEDNTKVQIRSNGTVTQTLDAGEYFTDDYSVPVYYTADKPILVCHYTKGGCCELPDFKCDVQNEIYSDPDMLLVSPVEQMNIREATVSSFFITAIDSSFINIVTRTKDIALMTRNGINISQFFKPAPSNPLLSYAQLNVQKGNHVLRSENGFIAYVYGFGERDSYSYSGDVMLSNLTVKVTGPDESCSKKPLEFGHSTSKPISDLEWFVDGKAAGKGLKLNFTFNEAGTHLIKLVYTNKQLENCNIDSTFKEIRIYEPELKVVDIEPVGCGSDEPGRFTVTAIKGKGPYAFEVGGLKPTPTGTFVVSNPGTYKVIITDAFGCTSTGEVIVERKGELKLEIRDKKDAICGKANGYIDININRGVEPFTYLWSNGEVTQDISNINAGNYSVTVFDANKCTGELNDINIKQIGGEILFTQTKIDYATCGEKNGAISLEIKGGTDPVEFIWSNNAKTKNINGLAPGKYSVTATDINGCQGIQEGIEVPSKEKPEAKVTPENPAPLCEGENVNLRANVSPGYQYQWYKDGIILSGQNAFVLEANEPGSYTVVVTSEPCSTTSKPVIVSRKTIQKPVLTPDKKPFICQGDNVVLTPGNLSPGVQLEWRRNGEIYSQQPKDKLTVVEQGNYRLRTFDGNCSEISEVIFVRVIDAPKAEIKADTKTTLCNGEKVTLRNISCNSENELVWKRDGVIIPNEKGCTLETDKSGKYSFTVFKSVKEDENEITCQSTSEEITIISNTTSGNIISAKSSPIFCQGSSVVLSTNTIAGATYEWRLNGNPIAGATNNQITAKEKGNYRVRITIGDCEFTSLPYPVIVFQGPSLNLTAIDSKCGANGSGVIILKVNGGKPPYKYAWSNGSFMQNQSKLKTGTYTVTVTDDNGCRAVSEPMFINAPTPLIAKVDSVINASCGGESAGSIFVSVTGGSKPYRFTWNNGSKEQNQKGLSAGRYSAFIQDANGCSVLLGGVKITEPTNIKPYAEKIYPLKCHTDTTGGVVLAARGGKPPYLFSKDNITYQSEPFFVNLKDGFHTFYVKDIDDCAVKLLIEIERPDEITIEPIVNNVTCGGSDNGSIELAVRGGTPGYTYNLVNRQDSSLVNVHGRFTWLAPGKYVGKVFDRMGCMEKTDTLIVGANSGSAPKVEFATVGDASKKDDLCYNLTDDKPSEKSALWNKQQISLFSGFDFSFDLNFGENDNGGDGIVFVLQNSNLNAIGADGRGIGYQDMNTSYAIEFDTKFDNDVASDIPCDHISVFKNGLTDQSLVPTIQASENNCNIEDGKTHLARVKWDPTNKIMQVYFDGILRLTNTINLVDAIFKGDPNVFWGFTSATSETGAKQSYCVTGTEIICSCSNFKPSITPQGTIDVCEGETITLIAPPGYRKYLWSNGDTTRNLTVKESGNYYVNISSDDGCGGNSNITTVIYHPRPSFDLVSKKDVTFGDGFDGSIIVSPSKGTPPYRFAIDRSDFQSSPEFLNLDAAKHKITITDAFNCSYTNYITITEPYKFCKKPRFQREEQLTDSSVRLAWQKPENNHASSYILIFKAVGDKEFREYRLNTENDTFLVIKGLKMGTAYQWHVRSICDSLISLLTYDRIFTTPKLCLPPSNVKAVTNFANATITWDRVNFAIGYIVYYRKAKDSEWTSVNVSGENTFLAINNLEVNQRYFVKVKANCDFGDSPESQIVAMFTGVKPSCKTPTNVSHSNVTLEEATLNWAPFEFATEYEISYRELGPYDWSFIRVKNPPFTFENLTPGVTYQYRIKSICDDTLSSQDSKIQIFTTIDEPCRRPKQIILFPDTNVIVVKWTISKTALSYELSYKRKDETEYRVVKIDNPATQSYKIIGLTTGEDYNVRIRSICDGNLTSTWNDTKTTTIYNGNINCRTPINLSVTDIRENRATLTWKPTLGALYYNIRFKKTTDTEFTIYTSLDPQITLTNLTPSSNYHFDVQAICDLKNVSFISERETFRTNGYCPATTNIEFVTDANRSKISWDLVVTAEGYRVSWRKNESSTWDSIDVKPISTNSLLVTNLIPQTEYEFRVVVLCKDGLTSEARYASTKTKELCPSPTQPAVVVIDEITANFSWIAVQGATGYNLEIRQLGNSNWRSFETTFNTFSLKDLLPATEYEVRITTICEGRSFSDPSSVSQFKTLGSCPKTTNIKSTPSTTTNIVSWDIVGSATGYIVSWRIRASNDPWKSMELNSKTTNSAELTGLKPSFPYEVRVMTRCGNDFSAFAMSEFITLTPGNVSMCPAPTGLVITDLNVTTARAVWSRNYNAITYTFRYRKNGDIVWKEVVTNDTTLLLENLIPSSSYIYQIKSNCVGNTSSSYGTSGVFKTKGICAEPTNILITPSSDATSISWDRVAEAQGYFIAYRMSNTENNWIEVNVVGGNTQTATLTGLTPGKFYDIRILTRCETSSSSWYTTSFKTQEPANVCSAPGEIEVVELDATFIHLRWSSTPGVRNYQIDYRIANQTEWNSITTGINEVNIENLSQLTDYEIRIKAICLSGANSDYNSTRIIKTESNCTPPSSLLITNIGSTTAHVSWNIIQTASKYVIYYRPRGGSASWEKQEINSFSTNSTLLEGLRTDTEYEVRIQAICGSNLSDFSNMVNFRTLISRENHTAFDNSQYLMYPNPSFGIVNFKSSSPDPIRLEIFDATGKLIKSLIFKNSVVLETYELAEGVYICKFTGGDKVRSIQKLVLLK